MDNLKWIHQRILSNAECSSIVTIPFESVMCTAGSDNQREKVCFGDSGGPLVVWDGVNTIQIGTVSFTYGCDEPAAPDGFTRVSMFLNWISKVTKIPIAFEEENNQQL